MSEHIYRHKAIEAFNTDVDKLIVKGKENAKAVEHYLNGVIEKIKQLPSSEEESFEWCTDCKEYDQEKHCCHRWTKVIRNTVEELKVVKCKDCENYQTDWDPKSAYETHYCSMIDTFMPPYGFCSYGERRTDG